MSNLNTNRVWFEAKAAFTTVGDSLVYEGEIFRAGDYPDKGVNASSESLKAIAEGFKKAPAKVQHTQTAFDSALAGYGLDSVEARDEGAWLWGRFRLPRWVGDALGKEIPVSVGLSIVDSSPVSIDELSVVKDPRIPTARMKAAYAAFASARHSKGDMEQIQAIHDAASNLGADCEDDDQSDVDDGQMAGSRHSKADMADIQKLHDLAVGQGALCAKPAAKMSAKGQPVPATGQRMNPFQKLKAFFGSNPDALKEAGLTDGELKEFEESKTDAAPPVDPTVQARLDELEKANKAAFEQLDSQNMLLLDRAAADFADDAIRVQRKAYPAERESLAALYKAAALADGASGKAEFAAGKVVEKANVAIVRESLEKRPRLTLFESQVDDAAPKSDTGIDPKRVEALMSKTPLGKKALANKETK